jgi:hypothetical protein
VRDSLAMNYQIAKGLTDAAPLRVAPVIGAVPD